jgi:hypothetical protein
MDTAERSATAHVVTSVGARVSWLYSFTASIATTLLINTKLVPESAVFRCQIAAPSASLVAVAVAGGKQLQIGASALTKTLQSRLECRF